jgi:hypothetical protein
MRLLLHTEFALLLKRAGIKQSAFARMSGVTARQVNRWCRGDATVPLWAAGYVAALTHVPSHTIALMCSANAFTWQEVLGIANDADMVTARSAMKEMALRYHPDQGGSDAAMVRVNDAWSQARAWYRRR